MHVVGVTSTGTVFLAYCMKAQRYHICTHARTRAHTHKSMVNVTSLLSSKEEKQTKMRSYVDKYK